MKKIFFLLLLFITLGIATTLLLSGRNVPDETPDVFTDVNTSVTPISNSSTLKVFTNEGIVTVADVTKFPEVVAVGDGMYNLNGTRSDSNAGFSLLYSETDNSYAIAILSEPVSLNRDNASRYFLELLNITEVEACKLSVYIGTTADVNESLAGKNFKLSFCPGAVQL